MGAAFDVAEVLEQGRGYWERASDARGVLAPPAVAVHQLAKHLPEFHRRHPHVTVEVSAPGPVDELDDPGLEPEHPTSTLTANTHQDSRMKPPRAC